MRSPRDIVKSHSLRVPILPWRFWLDSHHHQRQDPAVSLRRTGYRKATASPAGRSHDGSISGEADPSPLANRLPNHIGCTPDEVGPRSVAYRPWCQPGDAVVPSANSELLAGPYRPIDFWEHLTINALAAYRTSSRAPT